MKVSTKKIWHTVIFIWLILAILLLSSCRVAKKEWVNENFSEKETVNDFLTVQDSIVKSEIFKLQSHVSKIETSVSKIEALKTSESSNETTSVSGTLTAEDGKEKSVTIGNTTIKSNGANVSFETSSSMAISKEFESKHKELTKELNEQKKVSQNLRSELNSLKSEFSELKATYNSEKTLKSQTVTKKGFTLGFTSILILIVLAIAALFYFRKKIPFI